MAGFFMSKKFCELFCNLNKLCTVHTTNQYNLDQMFANTSKSILTTFALVWMALTILITVFIPAPFNTILAILILCLPLYVAPFALLIHWFDREEDKQNEVYRLGLFISYSEREQQGYTSEWVLK